MKKFIGPLMAVIAGLLPLNIAKADPPPAIPEYLFTLPEGRWEFAELLWQGRAPCKPELCEAGYHSGDLVLSVMQGRDYLQAVAGVKDCQTVSYRVIMPSDLAKLKLGGRATAAQKLAQDVASLALKSCSREPLQIDATPLERLVSPPQTLAN